jgi:hypothetical protein
VDNIHLNRLYTPLVMASVARADADAGEFAVG